ncbi:MAG: DUF4382 domain-containing protein [Gammaproteobacteria bacterium]|uniref:DUF4382 domain-containing protein n=1 Tax=Rhodoferax sp. TaxID=50421 RepID=UPI001849E62A|nr:DUF4382 domain-containing protein [Rhodoferax sp.]MBU3900714.1 DUF4382 domain-containing protein [Gammaproteobacteria bacterium]MBA3056904.1 DUF4382 domain-containing protein [Rhodoferax sp.]MBU3997208.1 DUF4382 domain-containing protein [Gammaproteobacteria bacterium]MBU4079465.1 DUF4382 domain-containing protein [Gammaproteobacteria bacterium]MBU4115120.1 DUF4382 domain-containing protein [Gammaproteobacteria bacterium]
MKLFKHSKLAFGGVLVAGLAACGGGGGSADNGTLRLALTDAPACGYDAVNVTIQKIRVHQSDSANPDNPSGWSEIVMNPALRVDLLKLQNGELAELGELTLPTGSYNQMRLVLAENSANPTVQLANSVVLTGDTTQTEIALKTPSGQQSGVKAKQFNLNIATNQLANFVVDFDACKSVVIAGGSGQYLLKPQLSVIPRYISGVTGFVDASMANGFTSVSLQQGGVVVKATTPAIDTANFGKFMLPVAPGNYSLVLTAPGRTTAVVTNVAVAADTVTAVNALASALNPPSSATGTVTGTAPLDTLVRTLQALTTGPTIEVAGRFVDGITGNLTMGSYTYSLPVNAPLVAPYMAAPGGLVFAADTAAAAKYTLNASLTGKADQTLILSPLAAGSSATTNFTFP